MNAPSALERYRRDLQDAFLKFGGGLPGRTLGVDMVARASGPRPHVALIIDAYQRRYAVEFLPEPDPDDIAVNYAIAMRLTRFDLPERVLLRAMVTDTGDITIIPEGTVQDVLRHIEVGRPIVTGVARLFGEMVHAMLRDLDRPLDAPEPTPVPALRDEPRLAEIQSRIRAALARSAQHRVSDVDGQLRIVTVAGGAEWIGESSRCWIQRSGSLQLQGCVRWTRSGDTRSGRIAGEVHWTADGALVDVGTAASAYAVDDVEIDGVLRLCVLGLTQGLEAA